MDLLADLNEPQRRAVTHVDGPLLVLAGAGSGKTRVITRRVGYLIQQGVAPWHILAITFTNKAAGEMKQRVDAMGVPSGAVIGTFHGICARLLREFPDEAGIARNFSIYDQDDQIRCVKEAMERAEIPTANVQPRAILTAISNAKNRLIEPARYADQAGDFFTTRVAEAYTAYQKILAANHALDFDDLLMRADLLLRDRPDVREALARRFRYILIDEYQDTNHAQYVFAHGIALDHENICATGDPDQSIYGWRGADIRNIMEFEADYPNAVVIRLERNYRSTRPILRAAGNLIAHNRNRKPKELIATREGGVDVEVVRLQDEHDEARETAEIATALHAGGVPYGHMAIFYRVNALSRVLEQAFRRAAVPYQIARGVEFYNRKEIKDVLAYLKLLCNADDDLACERIINVPPRGIGGVTVNRLAELAAARGLSLLAATGAAESAPLGKAAAGKVRGFVELMNDLGRMPRSPVRPVVEAVLARSGMEASFQKDEQQRQALRNVQELVSAAKEFDEQNPEADLADYLNQVALVSDIDSVDPAVGAVTFMTLHAAKGLEFPAVIMVGCEEGLLPFQSMGGRDRDIEEERRLAFVGMTRAKDRLVLTSARYRMLRGQTTRQAVSPFLSEIGGESVKWSDKSDFEAPPRHGALTVDQFNRARSDGGFVSPEEERLVIEALEAAEEMPEEFAGLHPGRRVRSETFGPGTLQRISYDGVRTRAVILFDRAGKKTLILEMAHLEPL